MRRLTSGWRYAALAGVAFCGGCATLGSYFDHLTGKDQPQPVTANQFIQTQTNTPGGPGGADQSGAIPDNPRLKESFQPVLPPLPAPPEPSSHETPGMQRDIARVEREQTVATQPSTLPSTADASASTSTADASLSSGEYMPLGGVVAEVNGTPIYVNKVLQAVWPSLHNFAKEYGPQQFRAAAQDEITREIRALVSDELQFAAAEQNLDANDKKLVSALTTVYREKQITEAGGSVELARRVAAARGDNFDEAMEEKYRGYMEFVYQQRKLVPLLQPSAQEMRQYYIAHVEQDFTQHAEAVFDLLAINPAFLPGDTPAAQRLAAFDRAKQAHDRLAAGERFSPIFKEFNNDPGMNVLTHGNGNMGSMQRGSFTIKPVEDAVWALDPGKVSDVLEIDGTLYIAKMESRKEGKVQPFESLDVQDRIKSTVTRARLGKLIDQEDARLMAQAIFTTDPQMVDTALDMALRSYQIWNK